MAFVTRTTPPISPISTTSFCTAHTHLSLISDNTNTQNNVHPPHLTSIIETIHHGIIAVPSIDAPHHPILPISTYANIITTPSSVINLPTPPNFLTSHSSCNITNITPIVHASITHAYTSDLIVVALPNHHYPSDTSYKTSHSNNPNKLTSLLHAATMNPLPHFNNIHPPTDHATIPHIVHTSTINANTSKVIAAPFNTHPPSYDASNLISNSNNSNIFTTVHSITNLNTQPHPTTIHSPANNPTLSTIVHTLITNENTSKLIATPFTTHYFDNTSNDQ